MEAGQQIDLMQDQVLTDIEYQTLMTSTVVQTMRMLQSKDVGFQITIRKDLIEFDREFPMEELDNIVLLDLSGGSKETIEFGETHLSFVTAFGDENPIETTLFLKYENIFSVNKDFVINLCTNPSALLGEINSDIMDTEEIEPAVETKSGEERSLNAFKSNPKNSKLFQK